MLKPLLWLIAASQFALALPTLFFPQTFFVWMGLSAPAADNGYMIGMLGARFLASGFGMAMLAQSRTPHRFWLGNMALIQTTDFALGAAYLLAGILPLAVVAFPMANAALFSTGLAIALVRTRPALHPA